MKEEVLEHLEDCFNKEDECLLNRDYVKILRNYIIDLKQKNKQLKEQLEYEQNLNEKTLYKLSKYEDRTKELREKIEEYKNILKIQNEREYYSKFLQDFQKENGTNVLPDFDEVYKRYDNLKEENKQLKEGLHKILDLNKRAINCDSHKVTIKYLLKQYDLIYETLGELQPGLMKGNKE